jgi:gentisate 1,2-dioxygenase
METSVRLNDAGAERERYSREVAAKNLKPLWEHRVRPDIRAVAAIWRYADVRSSLMRAAELVTTHEAERRVLMLENPALPGSSTVATTLVAGMQIIRPGEVAPAHRHMPNALRFIVEGEGAYTTVDGERVAMRPGDFIVTRGWSWHEHGNLGSSPVIWMDGLDSPLARFFDAHRDGASPELQPPVLASRRPGRSVHYPRERMLDELERLARREPLHPSHGYRLRYTDPLDGRDPISTISAFLQRLPEGFAGRPHRGAECTVFNVVEGHGSALVGASCFDFEAHDVLVVPPRLPYRFETEVGCLLFSYSDRAAQEALGFWREEPETIAGL